MNFKEFDKTGKVEGFALIKKCDIKQTAKGLNYLDLVLSDKTGEITAKFWDYNPNVNGSFEVNTLVKVRGIITSWNNENQLKIDLIRPAVDSDNITLENYVPSAKYEGTIMLKELEDIINSFKDEDLKTLTLTILSDHKERLIYYPAAVKLHHAQRSGLLFHTLSIVRLAQKVSEIYENVDSELLICGAILHDIGKLYELSSSEEGLASGYTTEGTLIGHLVKGAMIVDETGKKLNIENEKLMLVEHMLISHHKNPEYGACVRPMFLEAEILSTLDMLDATIFEISHSLTDVEKGEFSTRQWALDNLRFYNHKRKDEDCDAKLF